MRKKLLIFLAIALVFLFVSRTDETSVQGEKRRYRQAAVAFANEHRDRLDALAQYLDALSPRPKSIRLERGMLSGYDLIVDSEDRDDKTLLQMLEASPIEDIQRVGPGWRFDLKYTSGWLDVGHYYSLYYNAPVGSGEWTPLDGGKVSHGHDCVKYIQNLGDGLYYVYEFCW